MKSLVDGLKVMVNVFRRECHRVFHSERTTIHGADGMLMVLQLAMAEVNKKKKEKNKVKEEQIAKEAVACPMELCKKRFYGAEHGGEFKVDLSDVLMAWKHLLSDRLHLPPPSFARSEDYDLILDTYKSFLRRSNTVDLVDIFSMYKQLRLADRDPEEPVSLVHLFEFLLSSEVSERPELSVPSTPSSQSRSRSSQVKTAVRRVFCSYLSLLVNSKNDMALAQTLDVPSRCLGRQAFTDIKHAAHKSNTSLFLAVTSFVRAVQLGGKGYAPAESDPLRKHVKGLSEFVHFLDNMEEILGEMTDPSACGSKLVAAIRAALVKGRGGGGDAVFAAADETARELQERICQLHRVQKQSGANGGAAGISPARPRAYAINHATAFGGRDTVKVLMALLDEEALTPPCLNKADLLSEDQPALSGDGANSVLALFRSPEVSTGCSPEPLRNRIQSRRDLLKPKAQSRGAVRSQFACTYGDDERPLSRVLDFPSGSQLPTCAHPAPKPPDALERRSDAEQGKADLGAKPSSGPAPRGAALGQRGGGNGRPGVGGQSESRKRKQGDGGERGGRENEPPRKRQAAGVKVKPGSKAPGGKKLIAGQGKLTSFFRV